MININKSKSWAFFYLKIFIEHIWILVVNPDTNLLLYYSYRTNEVGAFLELAMAVTGARRKKQRNIVTHHQTCYSVNIFSCRIILMCCCSRKRRKEHSWTWPSLWQEREKQRWMMLWTVWHHLMTSATKTCSTSPKWWVEISLTLHSSV